MVHRKWEMVFFKDQVWGRTLAVSLGLFFVFFSDAILSYWVPVFVQRSLGGSLLMGLVLAFSSLVGLGADLIFPEILKGTSVRRLLVMAFLSNFLFVGVLFSAVWWPVVAILLIAMGVWGVYYEFLGFANQQFVAESVPTEKRSGAWAVLMTFKSLAYFLGPILAGLLIDKGDNSLLLATAVLTMIGFAIFTLMRLNDKKVEIEVEEINVVKELSHWYVLFERVWPVVLVSLVLGLVDATFWTTGAVWSEVLAEKTWWGTLFLPFYTLPSLFMGFVVMKWGIYKKKKRIATIFMFLGGSFLALLGINGAVWWQLLMVVASSMMTAVTYPLIEAVYSDIVARMGRERKRLIGLSNSTTSLAYVIGPVMAGAIAQIVGEQKTFAVAGGLMALVALVLLLVTPKKLKVPQQEIKTWDTMEGQK